MVVRVPRDITFYAFGPHLTPAASVDQGEEVILETYDCFQGQIVKETDLATNLNWSNINPATGPVYINGVKPGDVVKIDLLEVKVADQAVITAIPGEGAIPDLITEVETAVLPVSGDHLIFKNKLRIPLKPMIGVIGFTPANEEIPNGTPDYHGGNMDCTLIGQGTSLYLTAQLDGGLLGAGDFHSVMGDGEILVVGAETNGEVRFKANVVEYKELPTPFLETEDLYVTIYSADSLDAACSGAVYRMSHFLTHFARLDQNTAGMLMSLVGDLKICQMVDPKKTARFEFPKWVLKEYNFSL